MLEVSELIYETCKTYLVTQGKFILDPRDFRRSHHRPLLRPHPSLSRFSRRHHPALQPDRHRGQLRRGLVRHPGQHLRELADGLRQPARQTVSAACHSPGGGDEHRHAAHQRRAVHHAVHPAVHPAGSRRLVLSGIRDRRIARRVGAAHRGRHLHEDRGHRRRPDEDRLQHQGRRRAQPRRHRRLHRRQCGRFGGPERRRLRDLRRDRRRVDHVHPDSGAERDGSGAAAGVDLPDSRHDGRRQRAAPTSSTAP